jgi:DNA polymerase III psi subunit
MKTILSLASLLVLVLTAGAQSIPLGNYTLTPLQVEAADAGYVAYTNALGTNTPLAKATWLRMESTNLLAAAWQRRAAIWQQRQQAQIQTRWERLASDKRALLVEIATTNAPDPKPVEAGKVE